MSRTQTFTTAYVPAGGLLLVMADDYVIIIRIADGLCDRYTYEALGFSEQA